MPQLEKKLNVILEKMQEQATNGDTEVAHIEADDLLIRLVEELADEFLERENEQTVDKILIAYYSVSKWYA